jgi:hypothetical protein
VGVGCSIELRCAEGTGVIQEIEFADWGLPSPPSSHRGARLPPVNPVPASTPRRRWFARHASGNLAASCMPRARSWATDSTRAQACTRGQAVRRGGQACTSASPCAPRGVSPRPRRRPRAAAPSPSPAPNATEGAGAVRTAS